MRKNILCLLSLRGGSSATTKQSIRDCFASLAMTIIFMACVFSLFFSLPAFAGDEHQATADFVQAGDLYKQGQYPEAIAAYRKALDEGFESGALYYNLANAYYRDGQTGHAVLNYERASQLIPRDRDLKFNYRYLISRHPEIQPNQQKNFLERAMDRHIEFYTLDEMTKILFALLIVLGLWVLAAFHWRVARSTVMMVAAAVVFMMGVYAAGLIVKISVLKHQAVAVQKSSANFEPRKEATEHFQMPEGMIVKILKQEDGWIKIQRWDKKQGWVPAESLEKVER